MIPLDEVPRSGQLIIAVHFSGYGQYYANETRKALMHLPERADVKEIGIEFYPLDYWLKRAIVGKEKDEGRQEADEETWYSTRAGGGLYKIGFADMTPEKFEKLYTVLKKMQKTYWENYEILIASQVEGF